MTSRRKAPSKGLSKATLERLVEEATVDAYGESEQVTGLFTMIEDHLEMPFFTKILGMDVTVENRFPPPPPSMARSTPEQRLNWLEHALRLALASGALSRTQTASRRRRRGMKS